MLELATAAVVGLLAGRLVWLAARPWFAQPALLRSNYRNKLVPTAAGLALPLALFLVEAGRAVASAAGIGDHRTIDGPRLLTLVVVCGFCLLGTVDDIAGTGEHRGFRGHLLALAAGRVTTGLFKLAGGAVIALVAVGAVTDGSLGRVVADAALVALTANAANLLDRAPGRAGKTCVAAFVVLAIATGGDRALVGVAVLAGAAAALLLDDLRERLMLGDAGANPLGAALGLGVVLTTSPTTRNAVLVAALALNLLGELVSFSRVIDAVPPLRALDQLGRAPAQPFRRRRRPGAA
jgi:UDP-N-acetylmuramyl pentapeptide phosphotransferase/UDP-N-acetylglucosamine-1-phosphate transferase